MRVLASFLLCGFVALTLSRELPPYVYKEMQQKSPEVLMVKVEDVKTSISKYGEETDTNVTVKLTVEKVTRTATKLKKGSHLTVSYVHIEHSGGWAGPSSIPVLTKGQSLTAYLGKTKDGSYGPAARGRSFEAVKS